MYVAHSCNCNCIIHYLRTVSIIGRRSLSIIGDFWEISNSILGKFSNIIDGGLTDTQC